MSAAELARSESQPEQPAPSAGDAKLRELREFVQEQRDSEARMAKAGGSIAGAVVEACDRIIWKIRSLEVKDGGA